MLLDFRISFGNFSAMALRPEASTWIYFTCLAVCINKGLNQRHLELVFYLAQSYYLEHLPRVE